MLGRAKVRQTQAQQDISTAWYGEVFHRKKDLPKLESLFRKAPSIEKVREAIKEEREQAERRKLDGI